MSTQTDKGNLVAIAAGSAISLVVIQLSVFLYRVYFGPLSKFPGPKVYAFTRLAYFLDRLRGTDVRAKAQMHKQYGPVVRTSPTELSFNTAQAWKDIYGHRVGGKAALKKDKDFYGEPITGVHSIIDADDENHARQRRILAHSFSDKALKEEEYVFKRWTDLLIKKIGEHVKAHPGEPTDIVKRWNCATFDIMADLTFAEDLGMLEGGEYSPWVKTIYDNVKVGTRLRTLLLVPGLGFAIKLLLGMFPSIRKAQDDHLRFAKERVHRRLAKTPDHHDLWTEVLKRGEKLDLTLGEMEANGNLFMIAGTETTATLLSGLTFYLLKNPDKMAKLVKEVRDEFTKDSDISVERLQKMPYLNACIEEGLRIYPPVPLGLPRVIPPQGMVIDGHFIPGGSSVSVQQMASYRSKANFAFPDEFHPERWLEGDERFAKDDKGAFMPFSTGPRNCIGKNLAYHESRLLLASVLYNFDLELDPRSKDWHDQQLVFSLWEKVPLLVTFKDRAR